MKKLIAVLVVICLAFGCVLSYFTLGKTPAIEPENGMPGDEIPADALPDEGAGEDAAVPAEIETLDFDGIYALHSPEDVVMTVDGKDVTWSEYFYWFFVQARQMQNYFTQMQTYYGVSAKWSDMYDEDKGVTFGDLVLDNTDKTVRQFFAIEKYAEENGVELSSAQLESIDQRYLADKEATVGADATDDDFNAYIADNLYLSRDVYDRMNRVSVLEEANFAAVYGENGEKVDDETAIKYLTDHDYLCANHILLLTTDAATGEALDDETIAQKKADAQKIADELKEIKDVEKLKERFSQLKEEYCEDSGKESFPDGYTFTPGTMVTEFEDACTALEENCVSDVVESSYGYHIIMRLPLDPDMAIKVTNDGIERSGRYFCASEEYMNAMNALIDGLDVQPAKDFEAINLNDWLVSK